MFLILELIVMEGVCIHLTLGGAEMTALCSAGMGEGMGQLCSSAPQLGECHCMWRAYRLTSRCVIAVCLQSPPCRVRGGFDPPPEECGYTTIEDLQDWFRG